MTTLIGTNPDQIPVNSMLGGMAYQDPDSISVKDFKYSGNLLGNGDVVFGGLSPIWTLTGRTSLNVNGTSSSIISLSTASSANTSAYLYWDNLDFDIQNNTVGGLVRIGVKDYPDALIISSTGNLGLGVTPVSIGGTNATVHVHGVTGSNPNLRLTNADTGATASDGSAIFVGNAGGAGASSLNIYNCESAPIAFYTAATERMRIDASGNLTLSGTGATKLQEGTTAQRPASPQEGMIRKNSTLGVIEGYSGGGYVSLEAGRLINVTEYTASPGTDQSFTLDPKTQYILVEMIGGGGSGGAIPGGTYTSGHASVAGYGAVGSYCSFYIPSNILQRTYYYRIGAGGPSAGSTILAETLGALTSGSGRIECGAGANGHAGAAAALPPVAPATTAYEGRLIPRSGNFSSVKLIKNGGLSSNVGYKSLILGGVQSLIVLSPDDITNGVARLQPADLTFGYWGAGGRGEFKLQGVYSDVAYNGIQGMIRIYEYS